MKMKSKTIKTIGFIATIAGAVATVISSLTEEKLMEERIDEIVEKALSEREE